MRSIEPSGCSLLVYDIITIKGVPFDSLGGGGGQSFLLARCAKWQRNFSNAELSVVRLSVCLSVRPFVRKD